MHYCQSYTTFSSAAEQSGDDDARSTNERHYEVKVSRGTASRNMLAATGH